MIRILLSLFMILGVSCVTPTESKKPKFVESKLDSDDEGKGASSAGAEGTDTIVPTRATHVAGGKWHTVLLDQNGRVFTVGNGDYGHLGHGD